MTKSLDAKSRSRAPGHSACLKSYVKDNYFAKFDTRSYHHYRETHFNARLDVKSWQSHWSAKSRSKGTRSKCVLEEYVEDNYYTRFDTRSYHRFRETHFNARLDVKSWQSHWSTKSRSKGTRSKCVLEEYVEDNYYARSDTRSYHHYRETHFNARLDVKSWQSHWSAKSRSRAPGHSACLKSYVKDNYYARFDTHSYHRFRETHLNARLDVKSWQSHWSMKSRSRAPGHSACLKSISRTITRQGLTLAAITTTEKRTLMLDST